MKEEEFVSLYDFLGKPAGSELGKTVFLEAKKQNQPTQIREVSNPKYKGKIMLYDINFLKSYFFNNGRN